MRVLAPYVRRRHIEHHEIPLREERHLPLKFTDGQITAHVVNQGQPMQRDPRHSQML
jgi:hypothetical protein